MRVAKWHGLGNDYLVLEESEMPGALTPGQISLLCDRHLGLGSDGILLRCTSTGSTADAVARMRIFNPDGSESEMCGNGMRIFALYLSTLGAVGDEEFTVETLAGPIRPRIVGEGRVRVDMGRALFHSQNIASAVGDGDVVDAVLEVDGSEYRYTFVDVGNPHCVMVVDDPAAVDIETLGPLIETHAYFPNRVNAEFVAVRADGSVDMRVWERGVGETQACGTGATAVGAACVRMGLTQSPVTIHLLGGDLVIDVVDESDGDGATALRVNMTGPAEEVFTAELASPLLDRLGLL